MRKIDVVAAILHNKGVFLATQRGYGEFEGFWEFPGGKIEPGETPEAALKREIHEELGADIIIENLFSITDYDYPSFHLTMRCYLCRVGAGEIEMREHKSFRWLSADKLNDVVWLPADKEVVDKLKRL